MVGPLMGLIALALTSSPVEAALSADSLAALKVGDCEAALAQKASASEQAESLALARCALELRRPDEVLELVPLSGDLASYGKLLAAEAHLQKGAPLAAAEVLEGVSLPGEAGQRASLVAAQAWIQAGEPIKGRDLLRPLLTGALAGAGYQASPTGADPAEVRWWLAQNAVVRGESAAAVPVWKKIWTRNPTSPWAAKAAEQLGAQGISVPDASDVAGRALISERMATLKKKHLYPEALALHDLLPGDGSQAGIGRTAKLCFKAKDYPRAVSLYDQLSSPSSSQRFHHALAVSRTGDYERAGQIYRSLAESDRGSNGDQASYKLGYLLYDEGSLEQAIPELQAHLRRFPSTAYGDSTRWFIAWSYYRLGKTDDARVAFKGLMSSGSLAPQARYWLARLDEQEGELESANAGYEEVLRRWPFSGPAWFSAQRLGRSYDARQLETLPTGAWSHPALERGEALARVGLSGWARAELAGARSSAKSAGKTATLAYAQALSEANDFTGARSLAKPWCTGKRGSGPVSVAEQLCWPRPHGAQVMSRAGASGLDPQLPFGIMNAESGMRPEVTSPAGARGLMQLMPKLAGELHTQMLPDTPYSPDALYQPVYNATLGTSELAGLSESLRGAGMTPHMPAVIAGYNGGEEAVRRWLEASGTPVDADVWSENIGYTETRRYVRRVLGYLMRYRQIYGDG